MRWQRIWPETSCYLNCSLWFKCIGNLLRDSFLVFSGIAIVAKNRCRCSPRKWWSITSIYRTLPQATYPTKNSERANAFWNTKLKNLSFSGAAGPSLTAARRKIENFYWRLLVLDSFRYSYRVLQVWSHKSLEAINHSLDRLAPTKEKTLKS